MSIFEREFFVEISDVSTNNKLTNYGILRIMQEVAAAHSDELGISSNHLEKMPYTWLLLNWKLKVFSRPHWNSKLIVRTWPSFSDKLYSYRDFEILDSNSNIVAQATSKWVLINLTTMNIEKTSQKIIDLYEPTNTKIFNDESIAKLKEPSEYDLIKNYTILRSDIDVNGHANNLSYLNMAENILPDEIYSNLDFKSIEIMYKKECKLGDTVACIYSKKDNVSTIAIKSSDLSTLHCIIEMK